MNRTKRILLSLVLVGAVAALVGLGSAAFFSDTETSTDNVFQAGEIDLKIDNESYYNGRFSERTSWKLTDLTVEKFFDFFDLKPGDWGEDTISLHVTSNPAWVCANVELTSNPENGILDPEAEAGDTSSGPWRGELAQELKFIFWADDGDNVWECLERDQTPKRGNRALWAQVGDRLCERPLLRGVPAQLFPQGQGGTTFPIADASREAPFNNPMQPDHTYFIGKYWCFGEMGLDPVLWDQGENPTVRTGFTCDGEPVGNLSQGDGLTADISFKAVQARHNEEFVCDSGMTMDLENKDGNWSVIDDDTWGTFSYYSGEDTFHGSVYGQGLESDALYQITLNGPGPCTTTDGYLAGFGSNLFESGYWNNWAPGLAPTCTGSPGEGIYNMNLIDDHYTVITDGSGKFTYPFDLSLPSGTYTGVKVLVKKMLDTHVSPWVDNSTEHTTNLFETAPVSFTVN